MLFAFYRILAAVLYNTSQPQDENSCLPCNATDVNCLRSCLHAVAYAQGLMSEFGRQY